jgi:hypothetical protein
MWDLSPCGGGGQEVKSRAKALEKQSKKGKKKAKQAQQSPPQKPASRQPQQQEQKKARGADDQDDQVRSGRLWTLPIVLDVGYRGQDFWGLGSKDVGTRPSSQTKVMKQSPPPPPVPPVSPDLVMACTARQTLTARWPRCGRAVSTHPAATTARTRASTGPGVGSPDPAPADWVPADCARGPGPPRTTGSAFQGLPISASRPVGQPEG